MSERKLKWCYTDKLARLSYSVEGLDLHQLKELNAEHKRKTKSLKIVHTEEETDKGVEDFYKAVKDEWMANPILSVPCGESPLIMGYPVGEVVNQNGKPLKKKEEKSEKLGTSNLPFIQHIRSSR